MLINYYYILGIPYTATVDDIKKAYRRKAKLNHPDVNKSIRAKANFQLINEAYNILADDSKRRMYDHKWQTRYGMSFLNRKHSTPASPRTNYYKAYTNPNYYKKKTEQKVEKTIIDVVLFISLLIVGAVSLVMGVVRLVYEEWEGIDNVSGLLMGLWMLFLLLYGWNFLLKAQTPNKNS